ncbi:hypothetical protein [Pseudonocardia nigra]|uniref:hypothetical protein n=1 Tax=Pseudonocardia nigra TaxID=1921578 RepID=UPI001C5EE863|nr:hypothetical protein [Pseudonocardia nigra]
MADPVTGLLALLGALLAMGGLLLALRWTFGTGRNLPAPHLPDPDDPTGDGLLEEVCRTPAGVAAQDIRARLAAAGVRATVGAAEGGHPVLVFRHDLATARLVLHADGVD